MDDIIDAFLPPPIKFTQVGRGYFLFCFYYY